MGFAKLKDLNEITIDEAKPVAYIKWANGKVDRVNEPTPGYKAEYPVILNSGDTLTLTERQMGDVLLAAYLDGKSDVRWKKFKVTHNITTKQFADGVKEVDFPEFALVKEEQSNGDDLPF